jgi:hypothetical protein
MGTDYGTDLGIRLRTYPQARTAPAPTISSINPAEAGNEALLHIDDLAGAHFQPGATVKLTRDFEPDLVATNVVLVDSDTIACDLNLAEAAPGDWDVVVANPDGRSATLSAGFSVVAPASPQAMSIAPSSGANLGPIRVRLTGGGFRAGASVKLAREGEPDILATDVDVASPSSIHCDFDLLGALHGAWDVVITNPDGRDATLSNGFAITSAQKVWTGEVSAEWHTDANWTPPGVPARHQNVAIPDTGNDPVISREGVAVHDLTLAKGAVLDLTQHTLSVEGTVTNDGILRQTKSLRAGGTTDFLLLADAAGKQVKYFGLEITPADEIVLGARPARAAVPATAAALGAQNAPAQLANWNASYLTTHFDDWYNGVTAGQGTGHRVRLGANEGPSTPQPAADLSFAAKTAGLSAISGQVLGPQSPATSSDATVTAAVSGNQLCSGRASGVRRCYEITSDRPLEASIRFYYREAERNGAIANDLRVYEYQGNWTRVSTSHRQGDKDSSEGLYVAVRSVHVPSMYALDGQDVQNSLIYLPALRNR